MHRCLLMWPLQQSCSFLFTMRHVLFCVCACATVSFCVSLCRTSSQCFKKQLLWPTLCQQHYKSFFQTSKVWFITSPSPLTLVEVSVILWPLVWNQFPSFTCGLPFNTFIPVFVFFLTSHQKQKGARWHSLNQILFLLLHIFYVSIFTAFVGV